MPVAFRAGTDGATGSSGGSSTLTVSYTSGSGADRLLLVATRGTSSASAVSYAGAAMTFVADNGSIRLWRKTAPASGANNLVITVGSYNSSMWSANDWTGVDQTSPLGTPSSGSGFNTYFETSTLTCPPDGAVLVCGNCAYSVSPGTWTPTGGTSIGWVRSGSTGYGQATSYRTDTGKVSWNLPANMAYSWHSVPINPIVSFTAKLPELHLQAVRRSVL